jgi:carbon starvation protein
MNAIWLILVSILFYSLAYRFYGRFLARRFGEDKSRPTPAKTQFDSTDFVPAKNWLVLFGHHFSSICGAGPIVGPVLACAFWGWGPAFVWVLLGSIFMGAVSDYASLFVSIRSKGQPLSEIARTEVSPRARLLFSFFIWISLVLVIAVFTIFAAKTFIAEPDAVVPSLGLIPSALVVGWLLYQRNMGMIWVTVIGLGFLIMLLFGGTRIPVELFALGPLSVQSIWILILLIYCFIASVTPVHVLLQPRDYLASFILFATIGIGVVGVFLTQPTLQSEAFRGLMPTDWEGAGPLWPMLFVTIACGAISGFHALVSSGTTCKQVANEVHACRVGYGGMLTEGFVGLLVIVCVSAGLSQIELGSMLRTEGPIGVFGRGYGIVSKPILGGYGRPFAVMALNAFIFTTLDTATRIARYSTADLFGVKNKFLATGIVVLAGGFLAFTGQWARLWPAFGASNQLIAGLSLLVASCWLLGRGRSYWFTLIPSIMMLVTTMGALVFLLLTSLHRKINGEVMPDFFISAVCVVLIGISISIVSDSLKIFPITVSSKGAR